MAKVRVHELAKQVHMSSKDLLRFLADMGIFIQSASSTIEAPVVRRVLSQFPDHGPRLQSVQRPGSNPFATTYRPPTSLSVRPSAEAEAAAFFGIPVSQVPRGRGQRRRATFDEEQRQVDAWLLESIEPTEKRQWLAAGVGEHELSMVLEWKRCGMTIEDLAVTWPSGAIALQHLRGHGNKYTVEQIAQATRQRKGAA